MSRPLVGAYVCPRGVFCVEARARRGGVTVVRAFEQHGRPDGAADAARLLARALDANGVKRAEIAVVVRGFEIAHHTLSLPPARDAMLAPIIDRELRRLEPQITDPVSGSLPLPDRDPATAEQPGQRQYLVAGMPRAAASAFEAQLHAAGHSLQHLTALPAAFQRLAEDFDDSAATTTLLVPLPDGLFLGFFVGGGMRLAIEPPLHEGDMPDGVAMAEEAELGATFLRQQFRGAQVERALIAGPPHQWADTESLLTQRLEVPVQRLDVDGLSAQSLAALGAVLDARSPAPLSLGGVVRDRKANAARATLRQTAVAAVVATVVVGAWSVFQALEARRADSELRATQRRLEQHNANVAPLRQTADQRRLVRDAGELVRISARDREELQNALAAISGGILGAIRLDSLALERGSSGWVAGLTGTALGVTSGGAVQALHDFYRELPRRLIVEELALDQMSYRDTTGGGVRVAFQLSFVLPEAKAP